MLDKRVSVPMIAGIIFYGISVGLGFLCALNTESILKLYTTVDYKENIFPFSLYFGVIVLALYIGFYFIMKSCNGKNNRVLGIIMLIAYGIPGIITTFSSMGEIVLSGRTKGAEYLAAYSAVNNALTFVRTPFMAVSSILVLVAIGRFGIIGDLKTTGENVTDDNVYFGG